MTLSAAVEGYLEDLDFRVLPWTKPQGGPATLETIKVLFGGWRVAVGGGCRHVPHRCSAK